MVPNSAGGEHDRRIVPLREISRNPRPSRITQPMRTEPRGKDPALEAARHYLKFMLPSIPISAFVLSFIVCYLVAGLGAPPVVTGGKASVNPALPLLGAALVGLITAVLSMWIYFGFLHVSGSAEQHTRA